MAAKRTYLGPHIYVEQQDGEEMIVSWPGGHHRVTSPGTFLLTLGDAIEDTYHPRSVIRSTTLR